MSVQFTKYQGLGNDFILIDNRHLSEPILTPERAITLCDRHFGIGADGVIFVLPGREDTDYTMRIFNSDGSEPEMCGNGIRCLARFIADLEGHYQIGKAYRIHTLAGVIVPILQADEQITVDMGLPQLIAAKIPTTICPPDEKALDLPLQVEERSWQVTCVSMGNPHCITFVSDVAAISLATIGPKFECHPVFPHKTNAEFIEMVRRDYIKMRVWERGAGITLACGTGACASVVAGVLNNLCDRLCTVELPGGCLQIEWSANDGRVYMTGPAIKVFVGSISD